VIPLWHGFGFGIFEIIKTIIEVQQTIITVLVFLNIVLKKFCFFLWKPELRMYWYCKKEFWNEGATP
jgi:hypothetical protein